MTIGRLDHKKGATFRQLGVVAEKDAKGRLTPLDITGWRGQSQVRNGAALVANLTVEVTEPAKGEFQIHGDTLAWPLGALTTDIVFKDEYEDVIYSETFTINIVKGITQWT